MLEHTPLFMTVAVVAAFLVGLSKGGLPSVGTLSVPLMALVISPVTAAALLLPIYVVSDMFGLYLYRHHFSKRNLAILTPAAIVGIGLGWFFSSHLSSTFIGMLVGLVGLFFCFNVWVGAKYRRQARKADIPRGTFWGIITGLTSFVSHSGAPPFQMYVLPQHLEKLVFAGTSTILLQSSMRLSSSLTGSCSSFPISTGHSVSGFCLPLLSVRSLAQSSHASCRTVRFSFGAAHAFRSFNQVDRRLGSAIPLSLTGTCQPHLHKPLCP